MENIRIEKEFWYDGHKVKNETETPYKNGEKDGIEKAYYENGNLEKVFMYVKV